MHVRFIGFSLLLTIFVLGCGSGGVVEKKADVKGTVFLDGKPLPEGKITFAADGKVPATLEIKNGEFSGSVMAGTNKVTFGVLKVEKTVDVASSPGIAGEVKVQNILPVRYHGESKITEDIPEGGRTDLSFKIESK